MPSFLFGLGADARPAMLFISQQIFSAFNISNYVYSLSLDSLCTVNYSPLDVYGALQLKLLGAFRLIVHVINHYKWLLGLDWVGLQVVDGDCCEDGGDGKDINMFHGDI